MKHKTLKRSITGAGIVVAGLLLLTGSRVVRAALNPPAPINLTALAFVDSMGNPAVFSNPVGIDFQDTSGKLVASVNFPTGLPHNFDLIDPLTGQLTPFSSASGVRGELKIAAVHANQAGFVAGQIYAGNGVDNEILKISADGLDVTNPWVVLPGETAALRGSLFHDRYGVAGGDLIVVTGNEQDGPDPLVGKVWRIDSLGAATQLRDIGKHLEGVTTVPDDEVKYGPLAGQILAGDEDRLVNPQRDGPLCRIIVIDPTTGQFSATVSTDPTAPASPQTPANYHVPVALCPEDFDIIPANAPFFGVNFSDGRIMTAPASDFANFCGDILVTKEFPTGNQSIRAEADGSSGSGLNVLHWNDTSQEFDVTPLSTNQAINQWEHVTFAGGTECTPSVTIVKFTNGVDANDPNAAGVPNIAPGSPVTWTYSVTNTGTVSVPRGEVVVTDNQPGVTPAFSSEISGNGNTIFDPSEVWLYTASGTAVNLLLPPLGTIIETSSCTAGGTQPPRTAYVNIGTVTFRGVTATDPSSYCNPLPSVRIVKKTNGKDANDPNGTDVPNIAPGGTVTWTYRVTNTGTVAVPKADVMVTDSASGVTPRPVLVGGFVQGDVNANDLLDPNETWIYQATGSALNLLLPPPSGVTTVPSSCTGNGHKRWSHQHHQQTWSSKWRHAQPPRTAYTNVGTVTIPGASDTDPSSYCNPLPSVRIVKKTNGKDANNPNGTDVPNIAPGGTVTWTYAVTNTGMVAVPKANVVVTDDHSGVTPTYLSGDDGDNILSPGEVWLFRATGTALNLSQQHTHGVKFVAKSCTAGGTQPPRTAYVNKGTVTVPGDSATDPSSYCNPPRQHKPPPHKPPPHKPPPHKPPYK